MAKRSDKSNVSPVSKDSLFEKSWRAGLAVLHFAGPLLFFTNLTRNPYYTQITLLYVMVAIVGLLWVAASFSKGEIVWPRSGVEGPMALFLVFALVTIVLSWIQHSTLRPGISFEGLRVWIFTLANSVAAFYLPFVLLKPLSEPGRKLSIWTDILFAVVWCLLWRQFHYMKSPDPQALIWDPYGAIVWAVGLGYAILRLRKGEAREVIHITMAVTLIAGIYAISQYDGRDVIWASPVTPYGGRPVSTFGNPNFLSSYLLLTTVIAAVMALRSDKKEAFGFGVVAAVGAAAILSTLTRSTYVGLFAAFVCLGFFLRGSDRSSLLKLVGLTALFVLLIVVFPVTPVTKVQSPLARFTEIAAAYRSGESYGPWHQRLLIWSSAWDMVKERPFIGKGWGCFELFYPYYQGAYLFDPVFAQWRTHANNAHNIVMELWSQMGTIGLGLSLLLFGSLLGAGKKALDRFTGETQAIAAGLLAGWIGMIVDNFFGNVSIFFAMPAFLFWWNMGTLIQTPLPPVPSTGIKSRTALAVIGLFFLFTGVYYFSRWRQEAWYFQGFKEAKSNLLPQSIKSLEKAYAWFPGEVNTNYELGNSYARQAKVLSDQGSTEEWRRLMQRAVWAYTKALDANPGYDEIYFNRGVSMIQIGEKEKGIKDMRTAILINPLLPGAYGPLSSIYVTDKRWAEAVTVLEQGVRAYPRNAELWNNLGYVYGQINEHSKAMEATRMAVSINPMFKLAWQNYQAIVAQTKAKDPLARLPELMTRLSQEVNQRQFPAARDTSAELVRIIPENADVALSHANVLFYLNDVEGAIKEFERIIIMAPDFGAAYLNLGKIYRSRGDNGKARFYLGKAADINPGDAEAKSLLNSLPKN